METLEQWIRTQLRVEDGPFTLVAVEDLHGELWCSVISESGALRRWVIHGDTVKEVS